MKLDFASAGAAEALVRRLAGEDGIEVAGSFGAVGAMLERFLAGERCDVVILTHEQIARLVAERGAVPGSSADLGTVATSIAVRPGDKAPNVATPAALSSALLAADAIYFPDPAKATAGIHFAKVLDTLGIRERTESRLRIFPNGASAMRAMAAAEGHPIGCTQATEILATPGVRLVAPLPAGLDLETVYTAAVSANASASKQASAFVSRLTGPAKRESRRATGFGGFGIRPALAQDIPAIRQVVADALAEFGMCVDPSDTDRDLADLDTAYFSRGGTFDVVVGEDGGVAGCCGVYALDEATCELRKMYLARQTRGKGLGRRLLRRALAFARGRGFKRVELETASVLERAIAIYTSAGFVPIERKHLASRCDQAFALDL